MNSIPFPVHVVVFITMCVFAAIRGGSFPLRLTTMFAAFFLITVLTDYLIHLRDIDYSSQIVIQFAFTLCLFNYANNAPRIKYIKRFCAVSILTMINYFYMFICFITLTGGAYGISLIIYETLSFFLYIATLMTIVGIINGSSGGVSIFSRLYSYFTDALSNMGLHSQALPTSIWQAGAAIDRPRKKENR